MPGHRASPQRLQGSRILGILFALALIDASIIGAAAVSLSTAYAVGDLFSMRHSLHLGPRNAKTFYAYSGLIVLAATLVLIPKIPLGILTNAVQTPERIGLLAAAMQ